jgi:hypothetical protein
MTRRLTTSAITKGPDPAGEGTLQVLQPYQSDPAGDPANPPNHGILRRGGGKAPGSRSVMADGASSSGAGAGGRGTGSVGESVVIDYGRRRTTCGYCRSTGPTSISHGTIPEIPSVVVRSSSTWIGSCYVWNCPSVLTCRADALCIGRLDHPKN